MRRNLFLGLIVACLLPVPALAHFDMAEDPGLGVPAVGVSWDFLVTYRETGEGLTYSLAGAIPYVIRCDAWTVTVAEQAIAAGPREMRVGGSYPLALLRFAESADGILRTTDARCNAVPTLEEATPAGEPAVAAAGARSESRFFGWYLAPLADQMKGQSAQYDCIDITARAADPTSVGLIPFTGRISYAMYFNTEWRKPDAYFRAGYFVAGTGPWFLEAGDEMYLRSKTVCPWKHSYVSHWDHYVWAGRRLDSWIPEDPTQVKHYSYGHFGVHIRMYDR